MRLVAGLLPLKSNGDALGRPTSRSVEEIVSSAIGHDGAVSTHYFMAQGLAPGELDVELESGPFRLVPRQWQVGIWDWTLLATEHGLKAPYQFGDLASQTVNLDAAVEAPNVSYSALLVARSPHCPGDCREG